MRARRLASLWALCAACVTAEVPSSPEFEEAERELFRVQSETLDPTWGDPAFRPVLERMRRVQPGTREYEKAQIYVQGIEAGLLARAAEPPRAKESFEVTEGAPAPAAPAPVNRIVLEAPAEAPAPQPPEEPVSGGGGGGGAVGPVAGADEEARPRARPKKGREDAGVQAAKAAPEPRKRAEPKPKQKPVVCSYFDMRFMAEDGQARPTQYCAYMPRKKAQAECDAQVERAGIEGGCDCTEEPEIVKAACEQAKAKSPPPDQ